MADHLTSGGLTVVGGMLINRMLEAGATIPAKGLNVNLLGWLIYHTTTAKRHHVSQAVQRLADMGLVESTMAGPVELFYIVKPGRARAALEALRDAY
jgi:hypothetical protein